MFKSCEILMTEVRLFFPHAHVYTWIPLKPQAQALSPEPLYFGTCH